MKPSMPVPPATPKLLPSREPARAATPLAAEREASLASVTTAAPADRDVGKLDLRSEANHAKKTAAENADPMSGGGGYAEGVRQGLYKPRRR
jgi:hypothetical protein